MAIDVRVSPQAPRGAAVAIGVAIGRAGIEAPAGISAATLSKRGFDAKVGQTLVLPSGSGGGTRVLVGLGPRAGINAGVLRSVGAAAVRAAWKESSLATDVVDAVGSRIDRSAAASALVEGALLASYQFGKYKTTPNPCALTSLTLTGRGGRAVASGVVHAVTIFDAVALARDLVNEPGGAMTPSDLASHAERIAATGNLALTLWDEHDIERERLGALRGVSLGSSQPPRLIKLVYKPATRAKVPTVAIVGKGITFDSGGLSLKSMDGMMAMKNDMSGAAAVLGVMSVISRVAPACTVIAYACCSENMPGPAAIKPGDVLRARNGKTIEVLNTDAEGRLVLADGLSLAVEDKPDAIIDIATLTGAIVVALGTEIAGMFTNNENLADQVRQAGARAGETYWPMPLPPTYRKKIDSEIADMKNMGPPGNAGAIMAAAFLAEFVGDVPWVHLDIAGTARSESDDGIFAKGGTGASVRTLLELVRTFEAP